MPDGEDAALDGVAAEGETGLSVPLPCRHPNPRLSSPRSTRSTRRRASMLVRAFPLFSIEPDRVRSSLFLRVLSVFAANAATRRHLTR